MKIALVSSDGSKKILHCHPSLLLRRSDFFKGFFNPHFSKDYSIPTENPSVDQLIIASLYTGRLDLSPYSVEEMATIFQRKNFYGIQTLEISLPDFTLEMLPTLIQYIGVDGILDEWIWEHLNTFWLNLPDPLSFLKQLKAQRSFLLQFLKKLSDHITIIMDKSSLDVITQRFGNSCSITTSLFSFKGESKMYSKIPNIHQALMCSFDVYTIYRIYHYLDLEEDARELDFWQMKKQQLTEILHISHHMEIIRKAGLQFARYH